MMFLKQSTAIEVKIGPFVDQTDGFTAETGLTLSQADIRLAKEEGDWAQKNETTSAAHEENGWYRCLLNTTDTNTVGRLYLAVNESGALPVWHEFMVLAANVYDSLIGGSDKLQVHADEITAGLITSTALADNAIAAAKIATGAITSAKFAAGAIDAAAIGTDAIDADSLKTDAVTEIANAVAAPSSAAIRAEMDANSTKLADIDSATGDIQSRLPAALTGDGKMDSRLMSVEDFAILDTSFHPDAVAALVDANWNYNVGGGPAYAALSDAKDAAESAASQAGLAYASVGQALIAASTQTSAGTTIRLNDSVGLSGFPDDYFKGCKLNPIGSNNAGLIRSIVSSGEGYVEVWPPFPYANQNLHAYRIFAGPGIGPTEDENAIALLVMDLATCESDAAKKSLLTAALKLAGKTKLTPTALEIYQTDGATVHATQARTIDATLTPTSELGGAT